MILVTHNILFQNIKSLSFLNFNLTDYKRESKNFENNCTSTNVIRYLYLSYIGINIERKIRKIKNRLKKEN